MKRLMILGLLFAAVTATAAERTISNAMAPYLAGDGNGGFVLSWYEPKAKAVRIATLRNGTWSEPMTVAEGETVKANRADTPVIAVDGDTIVATYSVANAHGRNVYITRSTDAGRTWSKPLMPHPALASEFGFVSLTPRGDMVWLDGRGLPGGHEGAGDMQFHHVSLKDDGKLSATEAIDLRVCDCCPTAMVMTSAGPLAAYRDRSDDEVRDISVVRRTAHGWSKPKSVHADHWKIKGCPVNGPALDARGADVALAWFTGADDDRRVYVAFSRDAGANFGKPYRIDGGKPAGRVDVAFAAGNGVIVSWIEDGALHARWVTLKGAMATPVRIAEAAGMPRLAASKDNVAVAFAAGDGVRFAMIQVPRN